ncbi:MAG: helix-hairpin-helix domain-containing protein [Oscillospiraceae bacterium]|jgi:competence protein ComEA|nr:helix-hairpin-helix domain-containing protein [Oscillospiraceae bacterium]
MQTARKKLVTYALIAVTALAVVFMLGFAAGQSGVIRELVLSAPVASPSDTAEPSATPPLLVPPPVETDAPHYIDGRLRLNYATADELMSLRGVGAVIAARIIEYRDSRPDRLFVAVAELNYVSGIGEAKFAEIRDLVTVD